MYYLNKILKNDKKNNNDKENPNKKISYYSNFINICKSLIKKF